jgi:hypothetical protein
MQSVTEEEDKESVCVLDSRVKNRKMKFTPVCLPHTENIRQVSPVALEKQVESGLEFILSHSRESQFPRTISTIATKNGQKPVQDIVGAMTKFQEASWQDCRISAFGIGQTTPDLIFIDLDASDFVSPRALKLGLTATLKNIKDKLGGYPTVDRSGRGCHIIQPIHCPVNLDNVKEFANLTEHPNDKFLQFAKKYLSNGKSDPSHNPALRSCMIRIPGSLNSKCKAFGLDPEVKIIQEWDGFRPDYRLLIGSFYADLVGKNRELTKRFQSQNNNNNNNNTNGLPEPYIEKLLQTPITDYRKHARDLILVPYLVVRKGMTDPNQIYDIIMQWADKCSELKRLEPSRHEFANRTKRRIHEVMQKRVPHMRLSILKEKNSELYENLKLSNA